MKPQSPTTASTESDIQRFFRQRAELYGDAFYVDDVPFATPAVAQAAPAEPVSETFDIFREATLSCRECGLCESRSQVVFGAGNEKADIMVIGEAPGAEEDRTGEPFVGAAGQLLDKILGAIGFARADVYIANVIKCRPPGNRDPEDAEVQACLPYLKRQIEMVRPTFILSLGRVAAHVLLERTDALGRLRGRAYSYGENIKLVPTYHPAAMLRDESLKRPAWEDVKLLKRLYDENQGSQADG